MEINDGYVSDVAAANNAVQLFADEWTSAVPGFSNTGAVPLFGDDRIDWLGTQTSLIGKKVLELGPLEAGHTYMLLEKGASSVLAIEANRRSFLKCLIVKELLGLGGASFLLGDFVPWLASDAQSFDLVVASGVLYHMPDPLGFLTSVAAKTDELFIWTHFIDNEMMPLEDPRRGPIVGVEDHTWYEHSYRLYRRSYLDGSSSKTFCGGVHSAPAWLDRSMIEIALHALGFKTLTLSHVMPDHPSGPCACFFAKKS